MKIEAEFKISISEPEYEAAGTVGEITKLVESKVVAKTQQ
jgi:acyl carrier protein